MVTVLPGAKLVPSVVDTLMRSLDSSEWKTPDVPSAQESLMVLGWLGAGPRLARPSTSDAPVSQDRPTVAPQLGACRAASKVAKRSLPPPVGLTVRLIPKVRVSAPLTPWAVNPKVPVVAPALADTVSVLLVLPLAGGVTVAGLKLHVDPDGMPVQLKLTAELKPLVELTVHVLALLVPPWVTVRLDGLQEMLKSGVADATG